jgi:hypothetical protein
MMVPLAVLGLGVLWVTPLRVERSPLPEGDAAMVVPADGAPEISPVRRQSETTFLSLSPQNPVHIFVIMPLAAALLLLFIGAVAGFIWRRWLRASRDAEIYSSDNGEPRGKKARYAAFGLLLWIALSVLFIVDLLGSASLYPRFMVIYAGFWTLVGGLLLYDRPLRDKLVVATVFLLLLFSVRYFDWNSRKPFLRDFYLIESGMTYQQVEQVMSDYEPSLGTGLDDEPFTGTVSYTHTDEGWGDSDIGQVTFEEDRVVDVTFLPD